MLFLAVFCGFLAENFREQQVEKHRAHNYAENLYTDLKKDNQALDFVIQRDSLIAEKLDSFFLISSNEQINGVSGLLYYYATFITTVAAFENNSSSIDQLIGSGSLRIMDSKISQKISEYTERIRRMHSDYQLSRTELVKAEELYFKIFTPVHGTPFTFAGLTKKRDELIMNKLPLLDDDKKKLGEFKGWAQFVSHTYKFYNNVYLLPLKKLNEELIQLLETKYHLN